MMPLIILKAVLGFVRDNWRLAIVAIVGCVVLVFALSWHHRGVRADAAEAAELQARRQAKRALEVGMAWRDVAKECSEAALLLQRLNVEFEEALAEALEKPPKVITKYKERETEISEHEFSPDCETAIGELADMLADVPEWRDGS